MNVNIIMDMADNLSEECRKSYRVGDSFYTTRELASKLRVSATTANRILQLLEKRGLISRSQRNGSVILAPLPAQSQLDVVVVFRAIESKKSLSWTNTGIPFVQGVQEVFPEADIRVVEIGKSDKSSIWDMVEANSRRNSRNGFVLWTMPIEDQRFFAQSRYPSVIFGSRFPSVDPIIPAVDFRPSDGTGQIADFLRARKRKKYLCLHASTLFAGDILYLDAMQETLSKLQFRLKALPPDQEAMCFETARTIKQFKPDAIICQNEDMARYAFEACQELNMELEKKVDIVSFFSDFDLARSQFFFPSLVSRWTLDQCGREVAKLLAKKVQNERAGDVAIPLDFYIPDPLYRVEAAADI
ncbi:MAG: MarR family transcriptional regulator [Thermoguttaceae bacterium]|nr:MarR family transcriptional regulator [Thermoguttaceae bacterium]